MHKSCLQALSGLADYENLLLELEKENHSLDNTGEGIVPANRVHLDDGIVLFKFQLILYCSSRILDFFYFFLQ